MTNTKDNKKNTFTSFFQKTLLKIEDLVTVIIALTILIIVFISLIRIIHITYDTMIHDAFSNQEIKFETYTEIFAKIITLLISFEFLNTITKALKTHEIRMLTLDVSLITALAIFRKIIILDYPDGNAYALIGLGLVIISLGIFYFLITYKKPKNGENQLPENLEK